MRRYSSFKPRSVRKLERNTKKKLIWTIILVFALVFIFVNWGLPVIIDSLSFLNKSKPKTTENLEDLAIAPPVLNSPYEATNTAKIRISGYSTANSDVEIYLDDSVKQTLKADSNGAFQTDEIELSLGTNNIYGKTINEEGKKSLSSKNIRVYYSSDKPNLEVTEPEDNKEIQGGDKKIKISGKTDKDNSVTVNGITVIVNNEGIFSTEVNLNDGDNTLIIQASNNFNNTTQIEKKVKYTP